MRKRTIYTLILALILCSVSFVITAQQSQACSISSYKNATGSKKYRKKYITMRITSVSEKKIRIKLSNTGEKTYLYSKIFKIQRWTQGKWKLVKFKDDVKFPKCLYTLKRNSSKIITMKWSRYFDSGLKKGKYRMKWIGNIQFKTAVGSKTLMEEDEDETTDRK